MNEQQQPCAGWLSTGAIFGGTAVILGAFAAHGLESMLESRDIEIFKTGATYQMYHALAILITALMTPYIASRLATIAEWAFAVGILVFSGSLYLLSITGIKWLGAITPIGGLAFIIGWGCLFAASLQRCCRPKVP